MAKLEDALKPSKCMRCGSSYVYKSLGVYECPECGFVELDEYAKVRAFIEANGATSAVVISAATGVPVPKINELLREGRLEIPNGSRVYIKCENCGTDIRFGRLCPACAAKLSAQMQGVYAGTIGETPTKTSDEMRFLNRNKDRKR